MTASINFFDTYILMAIAEEIAPVPSFFRDRYFPTGAEDIFDSDKVLTEYQKGDLKMAAFVSPRVGDIPMDREGYSISEYQPAFIAPSRPLTLDDLKKRGFGEALYPGSTPAERAAKIQERDLADMDKRIARREEWMAVETMLNNSCTMQEYIDANTVGSKNYVKFFDEASEHTYTVGATWNSDNGKFFEDVKAMCRMLASRGLPAVDLVLGTNVADALLDNEEVVRRLDKNSGIITGSVDAELSKYPGVAFMGVLNFGGFKLNLFDVDETYQDENGEIQSYFPKDAAMVTAPGCGHMMYGRITQINYGDVDFTSIAAPRVPKFILDQPNDMRKLRLATRPLAAPKNYCPYIVAKNVIG